MEGEELVGEDEKVKIRIRVKSKVGRWSPTQGQGD